ncbi:MAG: hypothetical protein DRI70_07605 [Bacteroidetes bacterium]|nr:MAG: hypothetical protein DRI70_07605 [Bacteroidota bacterium]
MNMAASAPVILFPDCTDLGEFMNHYNNERTNQGKHCQGSTPMQTFQDGKKLYQKHVFENSDEEEKQVA